MVEGDLGGGIIGEDAALEIVHALERCQFRFDGHYQFGFDLFRRGARHAGTDVNFRQDELRQELHRQTLPGDHTRQAQAQGEHQHGNRAFEREGSHEMVEIA